MTVTISRRRVAAGTPSGGQFVADSRAEAGLGLTDISTADLAECARGNVGHFDCACVAPGSTDAAQIARAYDQAYESRAYSRMVLSARVNTPQPVLGFQVGDRISDLDGRALRVTTTPRFNADGEVEFDVISEFDRHADRPATVAFDPDQHLTARWLAPDVHKSARGAEAVMAGWIDRGDAIIDDEGTTRTVTSWHEYDGPVGVRMSIEATDADGGIRIIDVDPYVGIPRAR